MQLKINRKFLKELAVLPDKDRKRIEQFVFEDSINFENLNDVTGIKKTQGISKLWQYWIWRLSGRFKVWKWYTYFWTTHSSQRYLQVLSLTESDNLIKLTIKIKIGYFLSAEIMIGQTPNLSTLQPFNPSTFQLLNPSPQESFGPSDNSSIF